MKRRFALGLLIFAVVETADALGLCAGPQGCDKEQMEEAERKGERARRSALRSQKFVATYPPEDEGKVRKVYKDINGDIVVERYGDEGNHDVYVKDGFGRWELR